RGKPPQCAVASDSAPYFSVSALRPSQARFHAQTRQNIFAPDANYPQDSLLAFDKAALFRPQAHFQAHEDLGDLVSNGFELKTTNSGLRRQLRAHEHCFRFLS
ncbi:hypothetical protein EV715DRAFT_214592, partial [Schizophyllum commune]